MKPDEKTTEPEQPEESASEEKKQEEAQEIEEPVKLEELTSGIERPEKGGRVCITYGRDKIMNKQVVSLIRELGIDPIVMQDKENIRHKKDMGKVVLYLRIFFS